MDDKSNTYTVPGLERGLAILRAFTRDAPELGAPELIDKLGLPRSTVFRLLQTLERLGYLVRTRDGRHYRLGVSVLRMGFEYLASQSVVEFGRPLIDRLSVSAGLPAHLVVRDGRSIIYVACARPPSAFTGTVAVGTRLPAHATVFGRILLGEYELSGLRDIFPEKRLERTSGQTPDSVEALHTLVQKDRARGFGISEGFYEPQISTIAVPVRDHRDEIVAAVGLTVAGAKVGAALIDHGVVEQAVDTAARISANLGYNGIAYERARANALALHSRHGRKAS